MELLHLTDGEDNSMKKNNFIRLVALLAIVALFAFRMYNSKQQKKAREEQQQMINDLANQQLKDRVERDKQQQEDFMQQMNEDAMNNIDSIQQGLDEVGVNLRKRQEEFHRKMDSIQNE